MARRGNRTRPAPPPQPAVTPPPPGGAYRPLADLDRDRIVDHAFEMLEHVGMADAPDRYAELLVAAGGRRRDDGRILLARSMVEAALERAPSTVELPGFVEDRGVSIGGRGVHIGTGGAAVQVLDAASGAYRDSQLRDLWSMMTCGKPTSRARS